jgi:RimK family alpha-L-glutamate ligase
VLNKGLVITNAFTLIKDTGAMIGRFQEEFAPYGVSLDHLTNDHVLAYLGSDGNAHSPLEGKYDFIIYLDKDYYIGHLLELSGFRLFNRAEAVRICDDKMLTHLALTNIGIKMPKTINYPLRFGEGGSSVFLKRVIDELGFPMVVKNCFGSLGEQVHLIKDEESLNKISEELKDVPHIYQKFISTSFGRDLRIALVGGKVVANMYRVAQTPGEFRSNIETGGLGRMIETPPAFREVAEKAAKAIGLDYCGLDILYGKDDEPILCEVNSNAYFGPIERFSGVNVASIYVRHIMKEIYGR